MPFGIAIVVFVVFCMFPQQSKANFYTTHINPTTYSNIGTPEDVIVLSDGSMWYADSQNARVVKISADGTILRTIGRSGSDEGEFAGTVTSITQDTDGNLYVLDYCHVYKLDFNGGFIKSWASCGDGGGSAMSEPKGIHYSQHDDVLLVSDTIHNRIIKFDTSGNYLGEFGSGGSGDGQFDRPQGLTTDSAGNIYVVDVYNHRVEVFDASGNFVRTFGNNSGSADDPYYFEYPKDVEVLGDGNIIVTSQNSQRIKRYTNTGVFVLQWGENGTGTSQFTTPQYLAKTSDESIWVSDPSQKRLQKFGNTGTHLLTISNSKQENGSFINPSSVAFDTSGNEYVLDSTGRVQKFNSTGTYLSTPIANVNDQVVSGAWHVAVSPINGHIFISADTVVAVYRNNGTYINTVGEHGVNGGASGNGDFNNARGMDFDSSGNLYVADFSNQRIQKFDITHLEDADFDSTYNGGFVASWDLTGQINNPSQVFVDRNTDTIYVSGENTGSNHPIRKYNTSGVSQGVAFDHFGACEDSQGYYAVDGLFMASNGKYYVSDGYCNKIQEYNADGTYGSTIGSAGAGYDQFNAIWSVKINPVTGSIVGTDKDNHRVMTLSEGVKILNLNPSADVLEAATDTSLVTNSLDPLDPDNANIGAKLHFGEYVVSDFTVNLTQDRDWSSVNAILLPNESKSLVVNLNPSEAPGVSGTHSLYVVKKDGQHSVRVCTTASRIDDVTLSCEGYTLTEGDSALSTLTVDGIDYWKITGLTGTGAMGEVSDPPTTPTPTPNDSSTNGNSDTGQSKPGTPYCSDETPFGTDLFQINSSYSQVKLFFTPISNTNRFYISYSTKPSAEEHGVEVSLRKEGVQNYTVSHLKPNTTYYFKVRGQRGCKPGSWSTTMKVSTQLTTEAVYIHYKNIFPQPGLLLVKPNDPKLTVRVETSPVEIPRTKALVTVTPFQAPKQTKKTCFLFWCF